MSTTGGCRQSHEPSPQHPRIGGGLWHDLWPVLEALAATVIAGVFVMAIVFRCMPRQANYKPAGESAEFGRSGQPQPRQRILGGCESWRSLEESGRGANSFRTTTRLARRATARQHSARKKQPRSKRPTSPPQQVGEVRRCEQATTCRELEAGSDNPHDTTSK
jgi:hypothetical protein